jgi:hypothetical protein
LERLAASAAAHAFLASLMALRVGQRELVSQLSGFVGLIFELTGLGLEKLIALFKGSQTRSRSLTLTRHPYSADDRVYLGEHEWHFAPVARVTLETTAFAPERHLRPVRVARAPQSQHNADL